jgi:hypothetical protein
MTILMFMGFCGLTLFAGFQFLGILYLGMLGSWKKFSVPVFLAGAFLAFCIYGVVYFSPFSITIK